MKPFVRATMLLNIVSEILADPLPKGRGSVTEPRASASGHGRIIMALCLSVALFLIACGHSNQSSEPEKHYALSGEVMSLNAKDQTATVKAGPIKGWMEAMTMEFPVKSKLEFDSLRVGEKINATVDVHDDTEYSLSHIQPQAAAK